MTLLKLSFTILFSIINIIFIFYNYIFYENHINLEKFNKKILQINSSYHRFVPHDFTLLLGKKNIELVKLGDQVMQDMSVMFFDMKDFTPTTELMSEKKIIDLMNEIFGVLQPVILKNGGIINKFLGDGAMIIFPNGESNAVYAAIGMLNAIKELNKRRIKNSLKPIEIGIGINSGSLILGIVGGEKRLEYTVYGKTVTLASRVEQLTRKYGVCLLITENVYSRMNVEIRKYAHIIGNVKVKGSAGIIKIYEIKV